MKIKLVYVGKSKKGYLQGSLSDFYKRIQKYVSLEEVVIQDVPNAKSLDSFKRNDLEGKSVLKRLKDSDIVVLLDEKGKGYDSRGFAKFIEDKMLYSRQDMAFVVGGAYGFSPEMYERADFKIKLSDMTFSHQLIRLIMAEQLYRAMTIIKGHPYHND